MSGFTCAKCGAFGLSEDPGECGFRGADGVACDGERTFSPEQLRLTRRAAFAEERAARGEAEVARLRAALSAIAALQTDRPVGAPHRGSDAVDRKSAYYIGVFDGRADARFEASEMARAALEGAK